MTNARNKIVELDLNDVLPNRFQPRIKFNEESIIELSESIKEHGVIQPIVVRPIGDKYEIIVGERRYKACVLAGLSTIPSLIIDVNDKDSVEIALIENVQRKSLSPIEEAISYKKILSMGYLTQEQLASKLGRGQSTIANKMRLLNLCDEVQEALMEEKISERHARSLLKLENADDQRSMLKRILNERLTVRKLDEEIIKFMKSQEKDENNSSDLKKIAEKEDKVLDSSADENVIDISNLFDEEESSSDVFEIKKNDFLDTSLFSKFLTPGIDENKESNTDNDKKTIDKEKNGEKDNMINNEPIQNVNSNLNPNEPVVSAKSFGKFFDPSYFQDENGDFVDTNRSESNASTTQINNDLNFTSMGLSTSNIPADTNNNESNTMFPNLVNDYQGNSGEYIDEQTFEQFLDPAFVDGQNNTDKPENREVIDSTVFSKFLDPEANVNSAPENVSAEAPTAMPTTSFAQYLDSNKSVEDLMAMPSVSTNPSSSMNESVSPTPTVVANDNNSSNDSFSDFIQVEKKPDLLAPMSGNYSLNNDSSSASNNNSIFSINAIPNLSPDPTVSNVETKIEPEPEVEENVSEQVVPQQPETPAFVTATQSTSDLTMPLTPIIDDVDLNKLVGQEEKVEPEPVVSPTPIIDQEPPKQDVLPKQEENIADVINTQPIIITDYNKTYDPILPQDLTPKKPKIEFKQIINMVRALNDQIENLGFEIDTEEYDLDDTYQVIFKINKSEKK